MYIVYSKFKCLLLKKNFAYNFYLKQTKSIYGLSNIYMLLITMKCNRCNIDLTINNTTPSYMKKRWCKECVKKYNKEYRRNNKPKCSEHDKNRRLSSSYKEQKKQSNKKYRLKHKDLLYEINRLYRLKNKCRIYIKKLEWYSNNIDKKRTSSRRTAKKHRDKIGREASNKESRDYYQTSNGRTVRLRSAHKRRDNMGFNPLNEWFEGSHAHHINKIDIIYIPNKWNRLVYHNIYTQKNMEIINTIAFFFLVQQNIKKLSKLFRV